MKQMIYHAFRIKVNVAVSKGLMRPTYFAWTISRKEAHVVMIKRETDILFWTKLKNSATGSLSAVEALTETSALYSGLP